MEVGETGKVGFATISASSHFGSETIEVDQDPIHVVVSSETQLSPVSMVRKVQQESLHAHWEP